MVPNLALFSRLSRLNQAGIGLVCASLLVACGNQEASSTPQVEISTKARPNTSRVPAADRIFLAQRIYTGVADQPIVDAVAIGGAKIIAVGSRDEVLALGSPDTEVIDLGDGFLYPGFVDAHAHLRGIGERELTLNLDTVDSVSALIAAVAQAVTQTQPGDTVYGRGWIETGWPEARFPTRNDLDPVSPENPVILVRADGHALLANSVA